MVSFDDVMFAIDLEYAACVSEIRSRNPCGATIASFGWNSMLAPVASGGVMHSSDTTNNCLLPYLEARCVDILPVSIFRYVFYLPYINKKYRL